jgi:O-antigen/teichoic acid export membrane protein
MSPVHRSIFLSAVERYGSLLFFLLSTAILSRLLTPEEFGIFAIVNALTVVLAAAFQEFGGANYLVQRTVLSRQNIRTAFTVTLSLSVLVGAALFALGDAIAVLFAQDGLRLGIAVSVLNFALWPFSVTVTALLRRDMNFGTLAVCNIAGNFGAAAISIALAVLHYSFMAPIWGALAGNAVTTVLLIIWQKDPGLFRPSLVGYRDVMRFGVYSSGVVIVNVFYNFSPQLVLARVLDFAAAGLYSRAVTITQVFDKLVVQVLSPVIMPAILAQTRAGEGLKRIYLDAVELLTAVHWPFLSFFAIMAQPIVLIWLGPMWTDIVPLVRMLCIAYLALFAACLTYPVLVAVGSVRDALISSAISLPPSLVVIFIAAFFGVEAVAAAALLCLPFQAAVAIYFISRHLAIGTADLFGAIRKSGIVTAFSITGPVAAAAMVHAELVGPLSGLFLAGTTAVTGWLIGLVATDHPLLIQVRSAVRGLTLAAPKSLLAGEASIRSPEEKPPL